MGKVFSMKKSGIHHFDATGYLVFQVTVGHRCGAFSRRMM